jgi:DNA polymerase-2
LTGWNLPDFDLPALLRYCRRVGLRCELGRGAGEVVIRRDPGMTRESRALLPGRVVLDGLWLMRGAFFRLDDYRLETAAREILGRGKLFGPDGRGDRIEAAYREDPAGLAAYNLEDARLVLEILERTGLVELAVRRSLLTGMQPDRVSSQIASVDMLYLGALRARGRVAPSVMAAPEEGASIAGGLVLDGVPGLYRNIAVYDFKSLYPSLIRTFNIDPLTYVGDGATAAAAAVIRTPGGAAFRRGEVGILPALVARLWDERARARAAGDERGAQAIKILMNSLYGVLGTPASRLFSPPVANAIALAGQHVIRLAAAAAAKEEVRVLYGDTDSLFVDLGEPDPAAAAARAEALRGALSEAVAVALAAEFGCRSYLELELEKIYARFFMPGVLGSKKRYAGLVVTPRGETVELVGLEAVRRDSSAVARRFQRELLDRVFHDQPVAPFVQAFVSELRAGRHDAELMYRKALRKPLAAYTKTTPPHVKAARRMGAEAGRVVVYVVTRAGPEPAGATTAPLDYEHYVTQQLRPIADAVLRLLGGPDFDEITGARRQLSLF